MFGRSSAPRAAPPPPKSIIAKLAPLLIFFSIVGAAAYIGYQIYVALLGISDAAAKKLEDSNLSVSKDGLKVKVKEMHQEEYGDGMQRMMTKAWDYSSWPAYKSRLWNKKADPGSKDARDTKKAK